MSKSYLALIAVLVVVILGIGAFAFYRSTTMTPSSSPSSTTPSTSPSGTPQTPSSQNQPLTQTPPAPLQKMISLTVSSPTNGQTVSSPTLTVSGKTVANADVSVNDKDLKADANGNFSTTITLDEGDNDVFVTASDANGQYSEWDATITYTPVQ